MTTRRAAARPRRSSNEHIWLARHHCTALAPWCQGSAARSETLPATHAIVSEHLLRRLQRRVAEGDAESDDVKLYFVSTRKGVAHVSDLALNRYGEVGNWPEGFFGDEVGEVAAIARAGLTRRIREQSG